MASDRRLDGGRDGARAGSAGARASDTDRRLDGGRDGARAGSAGARASDTDDVSIGKVGKPHGLDGSFFVEGASDRDGAFAVGTRVNVDGTEREIVASKRGAGGRPVIRLDGAVARGATLAVPKASLPSLPADEYYAFQLVGLEVEEEGGRALGRVREVLDYPANDVLELDSGMSLPLVEACVRQVDVDGGRIVVAKGFADPE